LKDDDAECPLFAWIICRPIVEKHRTTMTD